MKKFWHTKTLFIQAGKYKWSYKHFHCIVCWMVEYPHKGKWLCTSCFDKERVKNKKRKNKVKLASIKFHIKKRILSKLTAKERVYNEKMTREDRLQYQKEWYQEIKEKNIEIIRLKWKIQRMKKSWKPMLTMRLWWKTCYFPFAWVPEKPFHSKFDTQEWKEYETIRKQYDILYRYYTKWLVK